MVKNWMAFTINRKVRRLILLSVIVLTSLIAVNVLFTYQNAVSTTRITIANQGVEMAESIAKSIDVQAYSLFLDNPIYSDIYWDIRSHLNEIREKIGVLHVYTLKIENREQSLGMIMGMPTEITGFDIGTVCTVPSEQVSQAFEGHIFITNVLDDPEYGKYISVGAPILDQNQSVIGYIGIDLSVEMMNEIKASVLKNSLSSFLYSVLFVIIMILTYSLIHRRFQKIAKESLAETEKTYQKEMQSILTTVRSSRHDYFNHLHVINGLLEHDKFEQALEYTRSLTKDIKLVELSPRIDHPALFVLLQTKWETAIQNGIDFSIEITDKTSFEHIQTTDLIKILSNLIDNAIENTILLPKADRMVTVICRTEPSYYYFEVENSGHPITEKDKLLIFQDGYSTKLRSDKHGHGLSIVAGTLEQYKGEVAVDSKNNQNSFRVKIPKSKHNGAIYHATY